MRPTPSSSPIAEREDALPPPSPAELPAARKLAGDVLQRFAIERIDDDA